MKMGSSNDTEAVKAQYASSKGLLGKEYGTFIARGVR